MELLLFSSGVQEHYLLQQATLKHEQLNSFIFGKLSLPDRGQCDINFSHLTSCDRVCKSKRGKCETSVSRKLTVHGIHNISEIK